MPEPEKEQQIQIRANDDKLKGDYSNVMRVSHTRDEFVIDFINIVPPTGVLTSRVIVSPRHFKRILKTMSDNLKIYEEHFSKIEESEEPSNRFGFHVE